MDFGPPIDLRGSNPKNEAVCAEVNEQRYFQHAPIRAAPTVLNGRRSSEPRNHITVYDEHIGSAFIPALRGVQSLPQMDPSGVNSPQKRTAWQAL
jgi:hypothetical protein